MKVREYLSKLGKNDDVTFIVARAVKDEHTPYYHEEYRTTPINPAWQWKDSSLNECFILNDEQPPIDWLSGAKWIVPFKQGRLKSILVISEEDFALLYKSKEQRKRLIEFIDEEIAKKENK